jgi:hypothetical protein
MTTGFAYVYTTVLVLNLLMLFMGWMNGTLRSFSIDTRGNLLNTVICSFVPLVQLIVVYMLYSDMIRKWWGTELK